MNDKEMKQFAHEVLNNSGLRETLRQKVEQIDRLESLDCLSDLRLTRMEMGPIFMAFYEGIATADLYPHVRANLIRKGVINRANVLGSTRINPGQPAEYESVVFGVSGNSIQVVLNAYNPNYKG